jgi:hypothetical protein
MKQRLITLTEKGLDAGPYYEVSCSVDCITYTNCLTESVYLPTVGSTAIISVADNIQCVKIVNQNNFCNNFIVSQIDTTTTTTTAGPTTTTTTTLAPVYRFYNLNINSGNIIGSGNSFTFTDQFDNINTVNLQSFGNRFYLYAKSGSFSFSLSGYPYTLTDIGSSTTNKLSYHITAGNSNSRIFCYQSSSGMVYQNYDPSPTDYYVCAISGAVRQGWPVSSPTANYTITQEGTACGTTTTTTTIPPVFYYNLTRFNCPSCTSETSGFVGISTFAKTVGYYYNNGDGYVYRIDSSTTGPGFDVNLDGAASVGTNCVGTCGI